MKIMAVCGHGIGSSFMMEMNIQKALKTLNIEAEVSHTDLASASPDSADVFVMARDIAGSSNLPAERVVVVTNIVSAKEFEEKLGEYFSRKE